MLNKQLNMVFKLTSIKHNRYSGEAETGPMGRGGSTSSYIVMISQMRVTSPQPRQPVNIATVLDHGYLA